MTEIGTPSVRASFHARNVFDHVTSRVATSDNSRQPYSKHITADDGRRQAALIAVLSTVLGNPNSRLRVRSAYIVTHVCNERGIRIVPRHGRR